MATVRPVELATDDVAVARRSRAERSKLRRELGRLDAVCLLISAIVVLDTLGAVAKGGAQTMTWLAVVAALFFVPAGLVIAELGAAFPNQGGPYVWTRLAFGRCAGSLVALIYFLETPVWVGGSLAITAVAVIDRLLVPVGGGWRVVVALGFVWATAALATGWSALALAAALWPGLGTGDPDAHLPDGFAGDRLGFTLAELVPLAAVLLATSLLARRRR